MSNHPVKKTIVAIAFLLLIITGFGPQNAFSQSAAQSVATFTEVKGQPEFEASNFEFSASGYKYKISGRGRGERTGDGTAVRRFNLRIRRGDFMDGSIYHAEYKDDLLLIYEVSNGESGGGFITRLDGKTLRIKWKARIPAFNTGPGLIEGNYAYVTAIGFIAKVNLQSGIFVWKHDNLYRDDYFNSFVLPAVEGDTVLFRELTVYSRPVKTVKVQKRTGKIISIS